MHFSRSKDLKTPTAKETENLQITEFSPPEKLKSHILTEIINVKNAQTYAKTRH
jgi:hypothetical protein